MSMNFSPRKSLAGGLLVLTALFVGAPAVLAVAGQEAKIDDLYIRRIDGTDAEAVQVSFIYTGKRADLGDLAAVCELADVISLVAQAHAEGDPERAGAVWAAGVAAVAHGGGPELELAKAAARAGDRDASRALRAATPVG